GFLFLGLGFMKESIEASLQNFDLTPYEGYHRIVFVLIGFVITALIQSSSATIAITLSALSTGVIPFDFAVAVVIGSELGTSIKIVIGAIGGISAKRRIAMGNLIFNLVITIIAYIFMYPMINGIEKMGVRDPVISLVVFQSALNLIGVVLFIPFLNRFSDFLEKRFTSDNDSTTFYIRDARVDVPESAMEAMEKEISIFIHRIIPLNLDAFHNGEVVAYPENEIMGKIEERNKKLKSYSEKYEDLKHTEGEILAFYLKLKTQENKLDSERLDRLVAAVRNAIYSAKSMKDVRHNRKEFRDSANDAKYENYKYFQQHVEEFYKQIDNIFKLDEEEERFNALAHLLENAGKEYKFRVEHIYKIAGEDKLNETDISSMLNTNREIYASSKAIIFSLKDYLLGKEFAGRFEDFPVLVER
ncbi:MAG: Na/Pi symporter, partial [Bacteroidota bacterium]|nr:Na/Pi symporter [Bacteroidota bacterium]